MRTIVCGRWNRHSGARDEARGLWGARNKYDAGQIGYPELRRAQDVLTVRFLHELEGAGADFVGDGSFRWDSVFDIARILPGCSGFSRLTRIPATNHFHRQPIFDGACEPDLVKSWQSTFAVLQGDLEFVTRRATKPIIFCLPGPYTLARQTANFCEVSRTKFVNFYAKTLREVASFILGATRGSNSMVRFEEPAILDHPDDWALFCEAAGELTRDLGTDRVRLILAAWYYDISAFPEWFYLPFGVFWLDFVDGKRNLEVLKEFPVDKKLVAGLFDARQTHEENLDDLAGSLTKILKFVPAEQVMLSTNTDLDFLPYDEAIAKVKRLVGFAKGFSPRASADKLDHQGAVQATGLLADSEFSLHRQNNSLGLPDLDLSQALFSGQVYPTSTVGSFPQPAELRKARVALRRGELDEADYRALVQKHTRNWLDFQEELDITLLVGGEFAREDMAAFYGNHFGGRLLDFVPSYENRRYRPVEYYADVRRQGDATLGDFRFSSSLTGRPFKETITGPATLADWALIRNSHYYSDRRQFRMDLAKALRAEIDVLVANGMKVLQVDEPALTTKMHAFDMDLEAIWETIRGLESKIYLILHICYSDMRALDQAFPAMLELPFHQIHMEMANRDYSLLQLIEKHEFAGKDIGLGVTDVHTDRIETVDEIVSGVARVRSHFRPDQIWLTPDCGLKERSDEVARAKLRVMAEAARVCRETLI